MAAIPLVDLLRDAWADLDRVVAGLDEERATDTASGSSYAWTVAHLANQVDSWLSVHFWGSAPHPLLGDRRYRFGGSGEADAWGTILAASDEVRATAEEFLTGLDGAGLETAIPYPGTLPALRGRSITLRYTLMRIIAHHYFHIGEIASKRSAAGDEVGDYPGLLDHLIDGMRAAGTDATHD